MQQENWRPSSYRFVDTFYEISTDASYTGEISITFAYDESSISGPEEDLQMFHKEGNDWVPIPTTVDAENDKVTGQSSSLSSFTFGPTSPATGMNTESLFLAALFMLGAGLAGVATGRTYLVSVKR